MVPCLSLHSWHPHTCFRLAEATDCIGTFVIPPASKPCPRLPATCHCPFPLRQLIPIPLVLPWSPTRVNQLY